MSVLRERWRGILDSLDAQNLSWRWLETVIGVSDDFCALLHKWLSSPRKLRAFDGGPVGSFRFTGIEKSARRTELLLLIPAWQVGKINLHL